MRNSLCTYITNFGSWNQLVHPTGIGSWYLLLIASMVIPGNYCCAFVHMYVLSMTIAVPDNQCCVCARHEDGGTRQPMLCMC